MDEKEKNIERRKENSKLVDRLHSVETEVSNLILATKLHHESNKKVIDELSALIKDHNDAIYGGPDRRGIREHVNNLKKAETRRDKHIMVFYGAIIVTCIKIGFTWIADLIKGGM